MRVDIYSSYFTTLLYTISFHLLPHNRYISYPRTETNIFSDSLDLTTIISNQTVDPNWGGESYNGCAHIIILLRGEYNCSEILNAMRHVLYAHDQSCIQPIVCISILQTSLDFLCLRCTVDVRRTGPSPPYKKWSGRR